MGDRRQWLSCKKIFKRFFFILKWNQPRLKISKTFYRLKRFKNLSKIILAWNHGLRK